ncbi:P-loop containing nucleoside triphosphate hydrolase protein [Melanomma pulvis-pyrius CBS 109.77]|uniref:P-loop containing nucleoside triphosphate hydrolase protein n=1 Tax=Melanomma pulvis-pyrius CBS 109.77 TaxID=1314802 RepID=A0A6A6X800_9PLEO|nr:P-loop containing nucleoside triphosphate hydrolase protein [Melanomma pulvis-pyrius CBS 109.77]
MREYIGILQSQARRLEELQQVNLPKRYQVLYRIQHRIDQQISTEIYLDYPEWTQGGTYIKSRNRLDNLDLFLERNKDISFLVYRTFNGTGRASGDLVTSNTPSDRIKHEHLDVPLPHRESICPIDRNFFQAITKVLKSKLGYASLLRLYHISGEIDAPYLFMYHNRKDWGKILGRFSSMTQEHLKLFAGYVFQYYGEEYKLAETLFSKGNVSPASMRYLFMPGEVLIARKNEGNMGYVTRSWPNFSFRVKDATGGSKDNSNGAAYTKLSVIGPDISSEEASPSDDEYASAEESFTSDNQIHMRMGLAPTREQPDSCSIEAWRWGFDTVFKRQYDTLTLQFPRSKGDKSFYTRPIPIEELDIFPLRFAAAELAEKLKHRGRMFWKCRGRCLVSYIEQEGEVADNKSDERYMIDMKTFQVLHPKNTEFKLPPPNDPKDELTPEELARDEPPDEQFQLLLPLKIKAYNLRRKKWSDLAADRISPVVWNKKVFETLVMDRKPKDLIQALISKQVATEKSTDLIAGKGNGLILLLHGGPGTGKTLTAESVAEIAEKPLYRVTCGDVGTKAEDVEKYLESVLHLGKIWDCVVLLDEADVFLEQRSLEDLQRNALVSVFLRILEYHEGILILTSNRVGTFDEAFRSRIQLALHYPSLRPFQRQRIWQNFFDRLDSFKDDMVNIQDLQDHLEDLSKFEMNGRQIRNVITTARQYAEWKGEKLSFEYLKDVIEISGKFDTYLTKLRGGFTYDQIAGDEGLR